MLRGYLWEDLTRDVADEFAAAQGLIVRDGERWFGRVVRRERLFRFLADREASREQEAFRVAYRELRERLHDERRGYWKSVGECSRYFCHLPREGENKLCANHGEIARRATAAYKRRKREDRMMTSVREKLPDTRDAVTKKIRLGNAKVYVTTGTYPDGRLGEVFLRLDDLVPASQGESLVEQVTDLTVALHRALDALATAVSIGLQYRIPLEVFAAKFEHTRFEPSGTPSEEGRATSPLDAVFRYLRLRYGEDARRDFALVPDAVSVDDLEALVASRRVALLEAEARARRASEELDVARDACVEARAALRAAEHQIAQRKCEEERSFGSGER